MPPHFPVARRHTHSPSSSLGFSIRWAKELGVKTKFSADQEDQRYINECLTICPNKPDGDQNRILNLSDIIIPPTIYKILSLGLTFIPSDDSMLRRILVDLIRIKPYMSDEDILKIFTKRISKRYPPNVSKEESKEFAKFITDNENKIIITKPDKTNTMVIMSIKNYFKMGEDLIKRHKFIKINENDTESTYDELRSIQYRTITKFNEDLDLNSKEKINVNDNLNFRYMYILPKIHKEKDKWIDNETPPGRPIVSCNKAMFKSLEAYMAKVLDGLLWKQPHWIKSAPHLTVILERLDFTLDEHELFVADVNELYPNINIDVLIDKTNGFLGRWSYPNVLPFTDALRMDLKNTYFLFNDKLYKLPNGILMGAPFSPALAYIYLHEFDDLIIQDPNILYYARYIDDIFLIRKRNTEFPFKLLEPYSLTLGDVDVGQIVTFLDLKLWICPLTRKLQWGTYFKETNNFSYVQWKSEHNNSVKKGIVISQLLRIFRTNSNKKIKNIIMEMLLRKFILLGYGRNMLRKLYNKVRLITATATCKPQVKKQKWQHIITHRYFNNIMSDINDLGLIKDDEPKISTYNARNIKSLLKFTSPSNIALAQRKKFYKAPNLEESMKYDNPSFIRNYRPSYEWRTTTRDIRTDLELKRIQKLEKSLKVDYNFRIPRRSRFKGTRVYEQQ